MSDKPASGVQTYVSLTVEDHIRTKDMWAGTVERIATPMMILAPTGSGISATFEIVQLSPALFKCLDEPIVNALDQAQRCAATTEIRVAFDAETGRITIENNGDGIPIMRRKSTQGMLIPQFVFGVVFTGSNMRQDSSSTLGGTNGIGVKITNIHSLEFHVETHDTERRKSYAQTWTDGMRKCGEPVVSNLIDGRQGTLVSFLLNYAHFKTTPSEFAPIVFTRVAWAAFYLLHMLPRVSIFWNGSLISATSQQFAEAIFGAKASAPTAMRIEIDRLPNAIVIVSPDVKRYAMSVINGIMVPAGNHLDRTFDMIKAAAKAKLSKELHAKDTTSVPGVRAIANRLAVIVLWRATGVHWSGQSKDRAQFKDADLERSLTLNDVFTARIGAILADAVISKLDRAAPGKSREPKIAVDKYTHAHFAGTKKSAQCRLFLAEGDSAKNQICAGISGVLNFDYYGVLSLQGVIPNVRKESAETGDGHFERSKKLRDNKFMKTLCEVVGLDFAKTYATPEERAILKYGGLIGCVDQDVDGVGNIFSLLLNVFHLYWPALLDAGYIQRLGTPIIRAYPKTRQKVLEFYSDEDYRAWAEADASVSARYKICYYKGLGTHTKEEIVQILRNIKLQIITYQNDPEAREMFEIYLGRDPALRRGQLSQPPPEFDREIERALSQTRMMPASYHLMREAHVYQLDNLHRKINDSISGANQVSCKIINGCLKIFAQSREERKVADIAGTISTTENYHHGEASLQDAIIRRAFIAPGGNQIPLLLPFGNFGSRLAGGQDAAQARYIKATFNTYINSVLYSADDYPLLDFHIDEGKRGEPKRFVPIIPLAITENIVVPAHGWKIQIWAREFADVVANVRLMIATNGLAYPRAMRPCCYPIGDVLRSPWEPPAWDMNSERVLCDCRARASEFMWHGYIIEYACGRKPQTWSVGTYEWLTGDTIAITELPLCVWTQPYINEVIAKIAESDGSFIKKFRFSPSDTKVDLRITFDVASPAFESLGIDIGEPGDQSPARLNDPIIVALRLRNHMVDNINLMMPDDSVRTFDTYEEVLRNWFPIRREFYARRIKRQRDVISLWVTYYENVVRFIKTKCDPKMHESANVARMTTAEAEAFLAREGFVPLDIAALESPEIKFEPDVDERVRGNRAQRSFAYILNLRERDTTTDGCAKFEELLAAECVKLAHLDADSAPVDGAPFIGARIWLNELAMLESRIIEGRRTSWQFRNFGRFTFA